MRLYQSTPSFHPRQQVLQPEIHARGCRIQLLLERLHQVLRLSGVLTSPRAVEVNVAIMRAFVRLREMLLSNADLTRKLAELEAKYDSQFKVVFEAIRQLMAPPEPPKPEIGFHVKEDAIHYRISRKSTRR